MTYTIETLFKLYDKNILATNAKCTRANILCAYYQLANAHSIPIEDFTYLQAQKINRQYDIKGCTGKRKETYKNCWITHRYLEYPQITLSASCK